MTELNTVEVQEVNGGKSIGERAWDQVVEIMNRFL